MQGLTINRMGVLVALVVGVTGLAAPQRSGAVVIVPEGYVLLHADPGTTFLGVPFEGVPLGTFDFGSGPVAVGNTDTIVHRLFTDALFPPDTLSDFFIPVAMHLKSSVPFDPGAGQGLDTYFLTLQIERAGGTTDVGSITLDLPSGTTGTFDWAMALDFDLRKGSIGGPIVGFGSMNFSLPTSGVPWSASDPALHISGVNDGFTTVAPFATAFPSGLSIINGANGGITTVAETGPGLLVLDPASPTDGLAVAVPEPATATLAFAAACTVAIAAARRRA